MEESVVEGRAVVVEMTLSSEPPRRCSLKDCDSQWGRAQVLADHQETCWETYQDVQGRGRAMQWLEGLVRNVQGFLLVGFEITKDGFHLGLLAQYFHYMSLKDTLLQDVLLHHMLVDQQPAETWRTPFHPCLQYSQVVQDEGHLMSNLCKQTKQTQVRKG